MSSATFASESDSTPGIAPKSSSYTWMPCAQPYLECSGNPATKAAVGAPAALRHRSMGSSRSGVPFATIPRRNAATPVSIARWLGSVIGAAATADVKVTPSRCRRVQAAPPATASARVVSMLTSSTPGPSRVPTTGEIVRANATPDATAGTIHSARRWRGLASHPATTPSATRPRQPAHARGSRQLALSTTSKR